MARMFAIAALALLLSLASADGPPFGGPPPWVTDGSHGPPPWVSGWPTQSASSAKPTASNAFIHPPPAGKDGDFSENAIYKRGQKMKLDWSSDLSSTDLLVWQQYPTKADKSSLSSRVEVDTNSTTYTWTVSFEGLLDKTPDGQDSVLYFTVQPHGSNDKNAVSHYFNVSMKAEDAASHTSAAPTQTSTDSTQASTSSAPPQVSSVEDHAGTISQSSGISKGAVAGAAIGGIAGGVILFAAAFWLWSARRRRNYRPKGTHELPAPEPNHTPEIPDVKFSKSTTPIYEAP